MVKHIVLYTFKPDVDKTAAVKLIASVLEPLVGKIPGLLHMEIRAAFNGMDYALYSEFESREALSAYAVHPSIRRQNPTSSTCWTAVWLLTMIFNRRYL